MVTDLHITEPFLFNPLKHHLGFIMEFVNLNVEEPVSDIQDLARELKHLGTSVMDIYTGSLSSVGICKEVETYLRGKDVLSHDAYSTWAGTNTNCYRIISLSDGSQWTLKYHDNKQRYIHIFPSRNSPHTFRIKSNTLKSALLYYILIGKDLVTGDDLNKVRPLLGLSPVKDSVDTEAITEMIEILRVSGSASHV
jgi:hypothetical protein